MILYHCSINVIFVSFLKFVYFILSFYCSTVTSDHIDCYDTTIRSINEDFLKQINQLRARHSLQPITMNEKLMQGAHNWARYLAERGAITIRNNEQSQLYDEVNIMHEGYTRYDGSKMLVVKPWYEASIRNVKTRNNAHLLLNPNGEAFGCGVCSSKKNTYVSCRMTDSPQKAKRNRLNRPRFVQFTLQTNPVTRKVFSTTSPAGNRAKKPIPKSNSERSTHHIPGQSHRISSTTDSTANLSSRNEDGETTTSQRSENRNIRRLKISINAAMKSSYPYRNDYDCTKSTSYFVETISTAKTFMSPTSEKMTNIVVRILLVALIIIITFATVLFLIYLIICVN